MYKNYQNFKKLSLFDFWLKLENKGGVEFFEWQEEFHNAGQIFTPAVTGCRLWVRDVRTDVWTERLVS